MKLKTIILLVLGVLAACTPPGTTKVGVIAPLTGDFASYGEDIRMGSELAAKQLNMPIELVFEDACMPSEAVTAAKKLVEVDEVEFISSIFCIIGIVPITPITEAHQMSVMVTASSPDSVLDAGEFLFSPAIAIRDEARAQAEFAFTQGQTASVLFIDTDFGLDYNKHFTEKFTELGGEVVSSEKLEFFGVDFRTPLTKVKRKNPDVLLAVHLGNQMGIVLKQAAELGINATIIGTYEAEDPVVIEVAGEAAEGFVISTTNNVEKTAKQKEFETLFIETFGESPSLVAAHAFDALMLQASAHAECAGGRVCMKQTLSQIK